MSDKQFLREFFSPRQYQRLVNFYKAMHGFWNWWRK